MVLDLDACHASELDDEPSEEDGGQAKTRARRRYGKYGKYARGRYGKYGK